MSRAHSCVIKLSFLWARLSPWFCFFCYHRSLPNQMFEHWTSPNGLKAVQSGSPMHYVDEKVFLCVSDYITSPAAPLLPRPPDHIVVRKICMLEIHHTVNWVNIVQSLKHLLCVHESKFLSNLAECRPLQEPAKTMMKKCIEKWKKNH